MKLTCPRILLANSRDIERELLAYLLQMEGYSVVQASDRDKVVSLTLSGEVDLVLLSAAMMRESEKNGTSIIEQKDLLTSVPFVVLGKPETKEEVVKLLKCGGKEWVGDSGFAVERLLGKIRDTLNAAAVEPAEQTAKPAEEESVKSIPTVPNLTPEDIIESINTKGGIDAFEFSLAQAMTKVGGEKELDNLTSVALRDPLLTVTILKKARLQDIPTDVQRIISDIGVANLNKDFQSLNALEINHDSSWDVGQYWVHSVSTSRIARMLAELIGLSNLNAMVELGGLIHDIGFCLLATHFPKHYEKLSQLSCQAGTINDVWETETIGVHHSEVGHLYAQRLKLPTVLQEAILAHDSASTVKQTLQARSRLVTMIIQTADRLSHALYPGINNLTPLMGISDEFESAIHNSHLSPQEIVNNARKIIAELLTEMSYEFPDAAKRTKKQAPPSCSIITYYVPKPRSIDVVRIFLESRALKIRIINSIREGIVNDRSPMIVNLEHITETNAQIESLTSIMAAELMEGRRGIILLPNRPGQAHLNLVPNTWIIHSVPTHPAFWCEWLHKPVVVAKPEEETIKA